MTVGLVIQNNYPIDSEGRTRKLAKSLNRHGKKVLVFARNTRVDPGRGQIQQEYGPSQEEIEYATVHRFSWLISTSIFSLITAPLPINPFWILWLLIKFRKKNVDCVITSDIRISLPAIIASRILNKPVITDLRENHVEYAKTLPKDRLVDHIFQHPAIVSTIEYILIQFSNEVWVNVKERRRQLTRDGYDQSKIKVVSNTPDLIENDQFEQNEPSISLQNTRQPEFTLVYVGLISEIRNLAYVIEAVAHLRAVDEDVKFIIAGEGPEKDSLKKKCTRLGVDESVHFLGWIDPSDVPHLLTSGDIGVIPHEVNPFTNTTVPNKLFNYMMAELPVLATDMDPVQRIIEETQCGRTISHDAPPKELAETILSMKQSDELLQMGHNGHEAVHDHYNWKQETEVVLSSLRSLSTK